MDAENLLLLLDIGRRRANLACDELVCFLKKVRGERYANRVVASKGYYGTPAQIEGIYPPPRYIRNCK